MKKVTVYISCDHAGYNLKKNLIDAMPYLDFVDFGTHSNISCDYNVIAEKMLSHIEAIFSDSVEDDPLQFGILICSSGIGMSMIANKHVKFRAALCQEPLQARLARQHNNANILCLGDKFVDTNAAIEIINEFVNVKFEGGRHAKRLNFKPKKCINLDYFDTVPPEYIEIDCKITDFLCGEYEFTLQDDVNNQEVTIFQSFKLGKFNDNILKLLLVCDGLQRAGVGKITLFAPFLPYTRQDKIHDKQSSLGSKLLADMINYAKINNVITFDLHATQIEGFFQIGIDHRSMMPAFFADMGSRFASEELVIVFPDAGAASRFKNYISDKNFSIAIINKTRQNNGLNMEILGDVHGKTAIILDDMIDSGGTLIKACDLVIGMGAKSCHAYATHGIFSGNALEKIALSNLSTVVVSNSVRHEILPDKIRVIDIKICE